MTKAIKTNKTNNMHNNKFNVIGNGILCGVVETSKQAQTTTATTMLERMKNKNL